MDNTDRQSELETISQIRRRAEDLEPLGATTAIRICEFFKPRVKWTQRVLGWFRGTPHGSQDQNELHRYRR